jgi:hypothetical protein
MPAEFTVAGSPTDYNGTLAVTSAVENANYVWAGPVSGSPDVPAFRGLVAADVPITILPGALPRFTTIEVDYTQFTFDANAITTISVLTLNAMQAVGRIHFVATTMYTMPAGNSQILQIGFTNGQNPGNPTSNAAYVTLNPMSGSFPTYGSSNSYAGLDCQRESGGTWDVTVTLSSPANNTTLTAGHFALKVEIVDL